MRKNINSMICEKLNELKSILDGYVGGIKYRHIMDRMADRQIDYIDLTKAIMLLQNQKLEDVKRLLDLPVDKRIFKLNIKTKDIIIFLSRRDDTWIISTVLDPKIHNLYEDEVNPEFEQTVVLQ